MNPAPDTSFTPAHRPVVLSLPGWRNSDPGQWQSRWEALYGDLRADQHDWEYPRRGDWMARLEEVVRAQKRPIVREVLPFPSCVIGSQSDPYCKLERAHAMAHDWGSRWLDRGLYGHINAESGLGDWPQGRQRIQPWISH